MKIDSSGPLGDLISPKTDYVYVMEFQNGKIAHMTKIWNLVWR